MPRVLILVAHRPERSPSQRYRFEQYIPYLKEQGFEFVWSPLLNEKDDTIFYGKGGFFKKIWILLKGRIQRQRDVGRFKEFDIIFIQREANFLGTSFAEKAAYNSGKKVIFDFDDAIWLADTSAANKKWEWVKNPSKFMTNVANAHLILAGNSYLANKAKENARGQLHVIPTTVDTDSHVPKPELREREKICIGWSGSFSTIKHFEEVLPVLKELNKKYPNKLQFKVFGDALYHNADLGIKGIPWTASTEVDVLNSFDIGIMPLPNDHWAKGKCGLKALTYMSCGIPVVMSAVGVNTEVGSDGNALLVNSNEEWKEALGKLIENKNLRRELGMRGRKVVEERYSVKAYKDRYIQLFKSLLSS